MREWGIDAEPVMTGTAGTWVEALAGRCDVGQGVRLLGRLPEGKYFRITAGAGRRFCLACGLSLCLR